MVAPLCGCGPLHLYTGADVSAESLADARRLLNAKGLHEGAEQAYELVPAHSDLRRDAPVNVVVSQKTMQHFPSADYTRAWLHSVASLGARALVLQFCGPCDKHAPAGAISCGTGWSTRGRRFNGARCQMSIKTDRASSLSERAGSALRAPMHRA